jgi:diguanylate cyclase (GGDEF)-like protein
MKRFTFVIAVLFGWAAFVWAARPAPLTTVRAVHALTNADASQHLRVALEATVTYCRAYERTLFVQDGDESIFVLISPAVKLATGDRILVRGTTQESFRPIVKSDNPGDITVLRHGVLPDAVTASYSELTSAQLDGRLVTVHGVIRSANLVWSANVRSTFIQMLADDGYVDAVIENADPNAIDGLLDAEVEITGVAAGKFDSKMQQTGVKLHVASMAGVKIVKRAGASSWTLPVTPMDAILTNYRVRDLTSRIRVHGTITYYEPGTAVVLQNGTRSIWISTVTNTPLGIGNLADATGFPDTHDGFLILAHGEILDSHRLAPVASQQTTSQSLSLSGSSSIVNGHIYDLVSIEGQVVTEAREDSQDEYILNSNGSLFSAIYHHSDKASQIPLPPMKLIPLGSKILVTGICVQKIPNPFGGQVPFEILMRSPEDIVLVANPTLLNVHNLMLLVGLLLVAVSFVGARGWVLERRVRQKTAALAVSIEAEAALEHRSSQLEQKRSRILEEINGSEPLSGILEQIAKMVSSTLDDAPCWCEIASGARLGKSPLDIETLRIVGARINARSGPALGMIYAGFDADTQESGREVEALQNGARLATLAMETRRLYSDLRHRSEFDLLTDIPNRFAMEKFMETQIEEAQKFGINLGLIYIDLDKFKPINDTYGHHVGDLYLQEVAMRMNRQLLGGDMLARLGGDEFAALVLLQHGQADLEKIVARLESCFNEPFVVEGHILKGSASLGVALFPEDGVTRDSLLSKADRAMYEVKNAK